MKIRNVIRLSESQLNRVIMESVKRVIREGGYNPTGVDDDDYDYWEDDVDDDAQIDDFGRKKSENIGQGFASDKWTTRVHGPLCGYCWPNDENDPEGVAGAERGNVISGAIRNIGKTNGRHKAWYNNEPRRVPRY